MAISIKTTDADKKPIVGVRNWIKIIEDLQTLEGEVNANDGKIEVLETNATKTLTTELDAADGGVAEEDVLFTLPENSLLMNVTAVTTEAFDGDATTTLDIGVEGTTNAYIHTDDIDVSAVDTQASSLNGTNNGVKTAEYLKEETEILATWTNDDNSTEGKVKVIITYIEL
jgi:hypothetical protein